MNGGSFGASGAPDPAVRARLGLADGEDHVPVYYPGTLDQRQAPVIDVRSGSVTGGVDMVVTPVRTATLTGFVGPIPLLNGAPARVQLQVSRNPSYTLRATAVAVDPQTGAFSRSGLAPGSYVLAASAGGADERVSGQTTVEVSEGMLAHVQVALQRGVSIPVEIVVDGDAAIVPLNLRVSLRTDPLVPGLAETPPAVAAADGSLILHGVAPGEYVVNVAPLMNLSRASPTNPPPAVPGPLAAPFGGPATPPVGALSGPEGAYVRAVRFDGQDVLDGRVRLDGRPVLAPIEIVIGTSPGQVDGVVVDASRRPARHVTAVLLPSADRRHRFDLYRVSATDAAGRFRFTGVPPGDYMAIAWEDVETGAWLEPGFVRGDEGRGTPLTLGEGMSVSVEIPVVPAR
jgi:hypothetical protein